MKTTQQEDNPPRLAEPRTPAKASIWQHYHILDVDDFTPAEIELVFHTADAMKEILSRPI